MRGEFFRRLMRKPSGLDDRKERKRFFLRTGEDRRKECSENGNARDSLIN